MNRSRVADWLQIGGNLGILVGLLLVGLQIRETNRITDTQFEFEGWTGPMVSNELIIGEHLAESWTRAMLNSDELTDQDLVVVSSFLNREWIHNARMLQVARAGFSQVTSSDNTLPKWIAYLGSETGLRWWEARQEGNFLRSNPVLRDQINERLAELGPDHARSQERFLTQLRKPAASTAAED